MEPAHPLVGRARSLLDQLLGIAQTRLELLSAEIETEKLALMRQWQLAIAAVVLASLAGVTLIVWLAVTLPTELRTMVLGAVFFILAGGVMGCALALRRRGKRPALFSRVAHQLRLDRASLSEER
ncbi:MAG: phage holin family protein [Gammaproteobacteria bacterium]